MPERLDRVQIAVADELVDITWEDRDALLRRLGYIAGSETIVNKLEAVGASRPVELDDEQRSRLRDALRFWDGAGALPDGLAPLLSALVRADPGGEVGTATFGG